MTQAKGQRPPRRAKQDSAKTPREIQKDELSRRKREAKSLAEEGTTGEPQPFVKATLPSSSCGFCWFCFRAERELLVASTTGVQFCRECACSLVEIATEDGATCWFCFRQTKPPHPPAERGKSVVICARCERLSFSPPAVEETPAGVQP